jgi:hypothetical protein
MDNAPALNERIVAWLRRQPPATTIRWYGDGLDRRQPWTSLWEDIVCDDIVNEVGANWLWTIELPWNVEPDQTGSCCRLVFGWPPDLIRFEVMEPNATFWAPSTRESQVEIVRPIGGSLTEVELRRLQPTLDSGSPDRYLRCTGAWTPETISDALEWWASTYADRSDLHFEWDPHGGPSPVEHEILHRLATDVGDSIPAEEAFAELLEQQSDTQ